MHTSPATDRWEHFEHEADVGVRGIGHSCAAAFEQAALALTAVITDVADVRTDHHVTVERTASDPEILLVDWLNALVFEMATRKWLFGRFTVEIHGNELRGEAWGEPVDLARHQPAVEVKGATFTALRVAQQNGEWIAQCVVDV